MNGYSVQEKHRANPEKTSIKQIENKKEPDNKKNYKRERKQRKEGRESLDVSLQTRNQSKRVPLKEARILSTVLSKSSKVRRFRSFQIHHRMHNGTKFRIWDECFPNQFQQPKSKSGIDLGITQDKPKDYKAKHHNQWVISQWRSKWSTVSPQWRHIMHQFTRTNLLNLKLSPVRILFQATHQIKKETCLGAFTLQIPFQGKTIEGESRNLL